jgi:hypothetical protein
MMTHDTTRQMWSAEWKHGWSCKRFTLSAGESGGQLLVAGDDPGHPPADGACRVEAELGLQALHSYTGIGGPARAPAGEQCCSGLNTDQSHCWAFILDAINRLALTGAGSTLSRTRTAVYHGQHRRRAVLAVSRQLNPTLVSCFTLNSSAARGRHVPWGACAA